MNSRSAAERGLRQLGAASCAHVSSDVQLDAARAVRRALADARRKAIDIAAMSISAQLTASSPDAHAFARRALGSRVEVDVHTARADGAADVLAAVLRPGQLGVAVEHADAVTKATVVVRLADELPAEAEQSSDQQ